MSSSKQYCDAHSYIVEYRVVIPAPGVWVCDKKPLLLTVHIVEQRAICERCEAIKKSRECPSKFINPFDLPSEPPKFRDFEGEF